MAYEAATAVAVAVADLYRIRRYTLYTERLPGKFRTDAAFSLIQAHLSC